MRADSTLDAFFAQGLIHARDRLWQMEFDRFKALGRAAELVGEAYLTHDVFMRRMELARASKADYEALDSSARDLLDAYASGVNGAIDQSRQEPPVEFQILNHQPEPWEGWHCCAVFKVRHVLMGSYSRKLWRTELQETLGNDLAFALNFPEGRTDTLIVPPGAKTKCHADPHELFTAAAYPEGSNNWAVHGSRTKSGLPLLAGDPHRALEVPNVYYQMHLACDEFDAIGLTIPGTPGFYHFGHNENVAWCITHAMADTQDLYREHFNQHGEYLYDGRWLAPEKRVEIFNVRGGVGADGKSVTRECVKTIHGPIVFGTPHNNDAISIRWTGTDEPNKSFNVILPMLGATSVGGLEDAMGEWVDPCNNVVSADKHNNISYLHRGRVPVRRLANGWSAVPGWTKDHDWTGYIAFADLPRTRNPSTGYIVTANNRVTDSAQYLSFDYAAPNRVNRIIERLESLDKATATDMAEIHADTFSLIAKVISKKIKQIEHFDGVMDSESDLPTFYAHVREAITEALMQHEPLSRVGPSKFLQDDPLPTPPQARVRAVVAKLINDETLADDWDEIINVAVRSAQSQTASKWAQQHRTDIRHPLSADLDPPSVGLGGDYDCILATGAALGLGIQHASVARYVFDLSDWDLSGWVVPLGSSGDHTSEHYADQSEAWANVDLFPMLYSWDKIEAQGRREEFDLQ